MAAGFDVVEAHAAHDHLLTDSLAPLTDRREDGYGGSPEARMRFPLEVVEAVRAEWPADRPLFVRVPSVDGSRDGVTIRDTVAFAREPADSRSTGRCRLIAGRLGRHASGPAVGVHPHGARGRA